jgi:hypothetical protein
VLKGASGNLVRDQWKTKWSSFISAQHNETMAEPVPFRVARWYIVKPKFPIWVNFGGPWNGKDWYILWHFGICICITAIWYILLPFGNLAAI